MNADGTHTHHHPHAHDHGGPARGSHDAHAGHSVEIFRQKFWLSLALTIPTVIWGHMLPMLIGWTPPTFPGSSWIAPMLGTVVFFYGGEVFLRGARDEIARRTPGMMTLVALAIGVAFLFSLVVTLGFPGMPLWDELATLVTVMLLGHWIEMRSISQASSALSALSKLLPRTATRIVEDHAEEIPLEALRDGDLVLVRPGARIPADGTVEEGRSEVDESMLSGESRPISKGPGDTATAGTVAMTGALRVVVTGTGDRTRLAGIMKLVERAQQSKSRAQALADRAAFYLTFVAITAAILTLVGWSAAGASTQFTVERVVTVLVIACPHALGLAIPLVIAISTTLGARGGLLVRNRKGLEDARHIDTIVFDKTGTLTRGEHRVVDLLVVRGDVSEALRGAAAVESSSEHPLGRAIVRTAEERGIAIPRASEFEVRPGEGVQAVVDGRILRVGGPNLLRRERITFPDRIERFVSEAGSRGESVVFLLDGNEITAAFAIADALRDESLDAIRQLHEAGIRVVISTGDSEPVARAVAAKLGIDEVFANVLPEEKTKVIERLRASGRRVAMVGDGVNDAPALVTADLGIAMGAGTDVAVEAGDVVLVRSDPRDVSRILALSRASYRKMVQNLFWAVGYNVVAIPLAAGVLAGWGLVLHPAIGAVLMSASTVIVALNAQLLRRVSL